MSKKKHIIIVQPVLASYDFNPDGGEPYPQITTKNFQDKLPDYEIVLCKDEAGLKSKSTLILSGG